jgi:hypothetical protein
MIYLVFLKLKDRLSIFLYKKKIKDRLSGDKNLGNTTNLFIFRDQK